MREEDAARYLSPLVKQDLAQLDADGDTRRLAVESLKLLVEQLDASTLPRFISQIAESRESGATRSYAISLYEEVARVHGKLVVPYISKVVGALVKSSSASGSFPQLQVANARVAASLARYGIDSTTSQEEAEEIMREICSPFIDALSGKLEPVAANAAACLHAVAETEKWKYAREEIVHEVCQRTTVALSEKATRTAAHMQLIRILASVNPDVLSLHGASLLRAGEEILKVTANAWQLRKAAAQMLQSVLTILDKETLETELNSALHVLDSCRLDKMPHVRTAVSDALHTAKMLASGTGATQTSFGTAASPIRKTMSTDRSFWLHGDHVPVSPVTSKRGAASPRTPLRSRSSTFSPRAASPTSRESRRLSFSPRSTSNSEFSPSPAKNKGGSRPNRAPLYPAARAGAGTVHSPRSAGTPGASPSSSSTTIEECQSPSRRLSVKEFNVRPPRMGVNGRGYPEEDYLRPLAALSSEPYAFVLPTQLDILGVEIQKLKEAQGHVGSTNPQVTESMTRSSPSQVESGLAQCEGGHEDARQAKPNSATDQVEVVLPRLKLGSPNNVSLSQQHSGSLEHASCEDRPPVSSVRSQKGLTNDSEVARSDSSQESSSDGDEYTSADVEVEKREIFTSRSESPHEETQIPKFSEKHRYNASTHPNVSLGLDEKLTQSVSVGKDFPPLVAPKRLVRSLSNLSNLSGSRGSAMLEQEMKLDSQIDPLLPRSTATDAMGDQGDAETSSEAGWSVRDNPIASEESYSHSSDEEFELRQRGYVSDFPKPSLKVGSPTPREIRMISPSPKRARSFDDGATLDYHPCPSCVVGMPEQTRRVHTPCQASAKSMQSPGTGLCSLLHSDETAPTLCSTCEWKSESGEDCTSPSKNVERRSGLMRMVNLNWKKIWWYTEAVLGGSLCLVIALPLAMIIAKALNGSSREYHLVPT